MEEEMDKEMETRVIQGIIGIVKGLRDQHAKVIPATWSPKVCEHYLHWAIWIFREVSGVLLGNFSKATFA